MLSPDKIKHLRILLDVTQAEVSKEYINKDDKKGCSRNFIGNLENGKEPMTQEIYKKLIDDNV